MAKMTSFEKFFVNRRIAYYFHRWFGLGRFLRRLPAHSFGTILEVGAGVGFTSELISEKYPEAQILATDFDEDSVAIAQRKTHLKNIRFAQADATNLAFPSEQFDAAFSVLVLHHIEDFQDAVREISRVLKPSGILYLIDIPLKSFSPWHIRKRKDFGYFSKAGLIELLVQNKFSVKDCGGRFIFYLECRKMNSNV